MSLWLVIAIAVVIELIVLAAVLHAIRNAWDRLARGYPPVPPAADGVRRNYQSFRLGVINLGFAFHVTADELYMHMIPARPLRWLGAAAASIPWDAMTLAKPVGNRRWTTVRIGRHILHGPAWCLQLAEGN